MNRPEPMTREVKYLSDPEAFHHFQELYITVRKNEDRILRDEEVKLLPYLPEGNPHHKEWLLRADTLKRFIKYLKKQPPKGPVLDLGCGNGWFTHQIAELTNEKVVGLDVNILELEQAARVFPKNNITFCLGDIFEDIPALKNFGLITLNASAQYFPDIEELVHRLFYLLKDDGEIHLLDTHFYRDERSASEAAIRTRKYYSDMGFPEMASHYYHHTFRSLNQIDAVNLKILFANSKLKIQNLKLLRRSLSPFPWIRIRIK